MLKCYLAAGAVIAAAGDLDQAAPDIFGAVAGLATQPVAQRFAVTIIVAFLPAMLAGIFLHRFIKEVLFSPGIAPWVVSIAFIVGGIIIWGGLNTGMEWTNRSEFCTSCHEMTIPYEELKQTVHRKLIERLDLAFAAGLSVLTGETGAGKSILIEALSLALGDRAESDVIRRGAERAELDGIVTGERLRRFRRAARGEIVRRGHHDAAHVADRARHQAGPHNS